MILDYFRHKASANAVKRHIDYRFDRLERLLRRVLTLEYIQAMTLDELKAKVHANADVEDSAILLLTELGDLIRGAAGDPAKIAALADEVDAKKAALAAAITANTPPSGE